MCGKSNEHKYQKQEIHMEGDSDVILIKVTVVLIRPVRILGNGLMLYSEGGA